MIKLELTKEEYKKLMDLVYIGDWVINSHRDENVLEEYEKIEDKIFSRASDAGFPEHADYDAELKEFFPSPKFDEEIHKYIDEYNDEVFWDESVNRLVERDLLKKYKNDSDVMKGMAESMKTMASYLVLVFFAAQFVQYFNWSNLGIILAINGTSFIGSLNIGLIPLVISFVIFSGTINLVMGSASAKWALLAPIFVPMFMFLGYTPELTQVVYRIGDSVTNIISPMMSFFALIIVFFEKYDKKSGIGTLVATMLPYSVVFFIGWIILLVIWLLLGWQLGPGAGIHLP